MSEVPLHPALVHLPLALAFLIPPIAVLVAVAVHRGKLPRWVWGAVLALQVVLVGSGALAMRSGEEDEERVEARVPEAALEGHEEAAERFVWVAGGLIVLFGLGVALPRPSLRSGAMALAAAGSVAVAGLALDVGHRGGELVYVHGAAAPTAAGSTDIARAPRADHDD